MIVKNIEKGVRVVYKASFTTQSPRLEGKTGTVREFNGTNHVLVDWDDPTAKPDGVFTYNLRLLPTEPTDEELAAEFRALEQKRRHVLVKLNERGYVVNTPVYAGKSGKGYAPGPVMIGEMPLSYIIVKTETKEI